MSTEKTNNGAVEAKKDQVGAVTEKLENLTVDSAHEANDERPPRRHDRSSGGRGGRGRGRGRGGRYGGGRRLPPRIPYEEQLKKIEEDQKNKKVLETGVKGYVKWFSVRGRYGFVARDNGDEKEDFFVHQTAIAKSSTIKLYLRTLEDEEPVVFDIVEGRKGAEAANVTGPDGANVKGSRYSRQLLFRFRRPFQNRGPPRRRGDNSESAPVEKDAKAEHSENKGEERGQRRPRRARGKLAPNAEKNENGVDRNGNDQEAREEKGNGDGAPAPRKRNNRRKNRGVKPVKGEQAEGNQEAVTA